MIFKAMLLYKHGRDLVKNTRKKVLVEVYI